MIKVHYYVGLVELGFEEFDLYDEAQDFFTQKCLEYSEGDEDLEEQFYAYSYIDDSEGEW